MTDSIVNERARIERSILTGSLIGSRAVLTGQRATVNVGDDSQVELG